MQAFATTISPRLYETDAMGRSNNATIAAWLEAVRGKSVLVHIDSQAKTPMRIPEDLRQRIAAP